MSIFIFSRGPPLALSFLVKTKMSNHHQKRLPFLAPTCVCANIVYKTFHISPMFKSRPRRFNNTKSLFFSFSGEASSLMSTRLPFVGHTCSPALGFVPHKGQDFLPLPTRFPPPPFVLFVIFSSSYFCLKDGPLNLQLLQVWIDR